MMHATTLPISSTKYLPSDRAAWLAARVLDLGCGSRVRYDAGGATVWVGSIYRVGSYPRSGSSLGSRERHS